MPQATKPTTGKVIAIPGLHVAGTVPDAEASPEIQQIKGKESYSFDIDAFAVNVAAAGRFDPKTIPEAKTDSESYSGKNFKSETLPDGWSASFENERSFFSMTYRLLHGTAIMCKTMQAKTAQRDAAAGYCKSLVAQ